MTARLALFCAVIGMAGLNTAHADTAFERQNAALAACGGRSAQNTEACATVAPLLGHLKACILGELQIGAAQELTLRTQGYAACLAAAEAGLISAQTSVGEYLISGLEEIVEPNYAAARMWLQKAGEAGHLKAQYDLARIYQNGLGAEAPDPALAFEWMTRAADAGLPDAIFGLGLMYLHGKGTAPDSRRAQRLIAESAELNFPPAQIRYTEILYAEAQEASGGPSAAPSAALDPIAGERALYWACVTARQQPDAPGMKTLCTDLKRRLPADVTTRIMRAIRNRPQPAKSR